MELLQWIVVLGGPGLLLGAGLGAAVPRWKPLVALALLGAIAFWYGLEARPQGSGDDDPAVLIAVAIATNFGSWLVGLALGAGIGRVHRHRRALDR